MFYPTMAPVVVVGEGTDHQITEPYLRFRLLVDSEDDAAEKDRLANKAFVHIIATRHGDNFDKTGMLDRIVEKCPNVTKDLSDKDMIDCLKYLQNNERRRGTLVSTPELGWVNKYVQTPSARQDAEKIVYLSMLQGDSHWDKARHEYSWTISKDTQTDLIRETIQSDSIGSKRKIELSEEIGAPTEDLKRPYFRKLLWDRHYDIAAKVGMTNEEDVLIVVSKNLNAGYFSDALAIVERFLPARQDLIDEIKQIIAVFHD